MTSIAKKAFQQLKSPEFRSYLMSTVRVNTNVNAITHF